MVIKRAANMGLGVGNQTFPLWELGAVLYWTSANGNIVQVPGGTGTVNVGYLDGGGATPTDPYFVYDVYRGQFRRVDPTSAVEVHPSGFVAPDRDNFFDNSDDNTDRGYNTIDGGLVVSNPAIPADHILDATGTGLTTLFRVSNTSGGALRFSEVETISSTFRRNYSVLAKRTDGGVIDVSVCELYISATHGGANEGTSTSYKKIREDGWYELMMSISPDASTTKNLGVVIQDGFTIDFEMPGQETSGTGSTSSISAGTNPPPNSGSTPTGGTVVVDVARGVGTGSEEEDWPQAGWIGCTIVHPYSMSELNSIGTPSPSDELPTGILVNWEISTSDRIRLLVSRSEQSVAAEQDATSGSSYFLQEIPDIEINDVNGMVLSWGSRSGTEIAYLYINGEQIEINTGTFTGVPTGGTPANIQIGHRISGSAPSNPATCWVQHVAVGRDILTRQECRHLSKWFEQQALNKFNV